MSNMSIFKRVIKVIFSSDPFVFATICLLRVLRLPQYISYKKSKICVYTSCFGSYDALASIPKQSLATVTAVFTDEMPDAVYDRVYIVEPLFSNARYDAKYFKINALSLRELEDIDILIWVDASSRVKSRYFVEFLLLCSSGGIRMRRHPDRNSIVSEAEVSSAMLKYKGNNLVAQANYYLDQGLYDSHLWHCALIVRERGVLIEQFDKLWWKEMSVSLQDQISAPFVEFKSGCAITPIPRIFNIFSFICFDLSHRNWEYESRPNSGE